MGTQRGEADKACIDQRRINKHSPANSPWVEVLDSRDSSLEVSVRRPRAVLEPIDLDATALSRVWKVSVKANGWAKALRQRRRGCRRRDGPMTGRESATGQRLDPLVQDSKGPSVPRRAVGPLFSGLGGR